MPLLLQLGEGVAVRSGKGDIDLRSVDGRNFRRTRRGGTHDSCEDTCDGGRVDGRRQDERRERGDHKAGLRRLVLDCVSKAGQEFNLGCGKADEPGAASPSWMMLAPRYHFLTWSWSRAPWCFFGRATAAATGAIVAKAGTVGIAASARGGNVGATSFAVGVATSAAPKGKTQGQSSNSSFE